MYVRDLIHGPMDVTNPIGCIGRQRHPPQSGYRTCPYSVRQTKQPRASLLRPARGVEEVGRLVWSATTCFPFRHHADLVEPRRFEEARELVHREVVGHVEHLATVVSREVGVSLAGQRKVVSVEPRVARIDHIGNARGRQEEQTAGPEILSPMPEEVCPMAHVADDRDHELTDDHVERSAVELRRGILREVGHRKPQRAANGIGGRCVVLCGVKSTRVDVHAEHGEPLLEDPPTQPPAAAAHVEEHERPARRSGFHLVQERVEVRRGVLARNLCGVETPPVVARVAHDGLFS